MITRILALAALVWALGFALFAVTLPGPAAGETTDGVVVVTGGAGRVQRGLDLLAAGKARRLLVSGADRRVRPVELAAQYRASPALVLARVDLDQESVDTRSNGSETAAWAEKRGYRSLRLVTTDWHMPRAAFELRRQVVPGTEILPDAIPSEPGLLVLITEYNKYLLSRATALVGL